MHSTALRFASAFAAATMLHACASMTIIHSEPEGAKVYADGELRGMTPLSYSDTKIVGSTTHLRLVKDGYQETAVALQRNEEFSVGACIGGVLVLVPFLWIMNYKAEHRYELTPLPPRTVEALPPIPFRVAEAGE